MSGVGSASDFVICGCVGVLLATGLWLLLRENFAQTVFLRRNVRGVEVPVGAGVILTLVAVAVLGGYRAISVVAGWNDPTVLILEDAALIATGFGLLGLFDDLAGAGDDRGFKGHVGALARGRVTTGMLKLIGGGVLAVALAPVDGGRAWWRLVLGALVIALGANLGNLFDRAPARCIKVSLACFVALVATVGATELWMLTGVAVIVGAAVGLVIFDAREQLMLGDAGSNVLGAMLGWGLVATTDWMPQVVVLVVLVGLNAASEKVSFSRVISDTPVLRAIDSWGRRSSD